MDTVVKPKSVRLRLSDVAKRALDDLIASKTATPEQLLAAEDRLYIAVDDGFTIDVKRRLNAGEEQDLFDAQTLPVDLGDRTQVNRRNVVSAKILAYLLTWTVTDDGEPIPMSPQMSVDDRTAALRALDPEVFGDIRASIDWHQEQVEQEIAAAKKIRGDAHRSSNALRSPVDAIGPTTTSVS